VLSQFESAKSSPKIFGVPDVTFAHPGIFKPAVGPGVSRNGLIYNVRPLKVSQYPSLSRTQWPVRSFQNLNSALEYQKRFLGWTQTAACMPMTANGNPATLPHGCRPSWHGPGRKDHHTAYTVTASQA
jgi:hypothetical protein